MYGKAATDEELFDESECDKAPKMSNDMNKQSMIIQLKKKEIEKKEKMEQLKNNLYSNQAFPRMQDNLIMSMNHSTI
jgi:hypothetical protein